MKLSSRQHLAAQMIAAGKLKKQAAEAVAVTPATISFWMRIPEFQAAVAQAQTEILEQTRARLTKLAEEASEALAALLQDPDPQVRHKAAQLAFEQVKPFATLPAHDWIGETDPQKLRTKNFLGVETVSQPIPLLVAYQEALDVLTRYVEGELTRGEAEDAIGVQGITKANAARMLADAGSLMAMLAEGDDDLEEQGPDE